MPPPRPSDSRLGELLVGNGLIQPVQLSECLKLQRVLITARPDAPPPALADLLIQKGYLTPETLAQTLKQQSRFCPRCDALVAVDSPEGAAGQCAACGTPLVEPPADGARPDVRAPAPAPASQPVPPEVEKAGQNPANRLGKYVLLEQLGQGGLAVVYRAWDTYLRQFVAVKRVKSGVGPDMAQEQVTSLLNEARNAIRLRHPNIVSIYDVSSIGEEFYISMEFLDGVSLSAEIRASLETRGVSPYHVDPRKWLNVLYQIAHAVHHAHTQPTPILHLDLKPPNVMVMPDGRACVLDFGLARPLREFRTRENKIAGTPAYMSPEQAGGRGQDFGVRTDVYGLGTMLYELLAGRPPFTGELQDVLRQVREDAPRPPSQIAVPRKKAGDTSQRICFVPPELEALAMRCLEKDPARRPATALEFAKTIAAINARGSTTLMTAPQVPHLPAPPRTSPPPEPPSKRRSSGVGLLMGAVVALVGLGIYLFQPPVRLVLEADEFARQASEHLRRFRPELVPQIDLEIRARGEPAAVHEFLERADCIRAFKQRLIETVSGRRPVLAEMRAGSRCLKNVRLLKAKEENLLYQTDRDVDELSWSDFSPSDIVTLSRACGLLESPEDRHAVALFCMSAGAVGEARDLFKTLEGTAFAARARARLLSLERAH